MVTQRGDSLVLLTMFNDVRDGRFARVSEAAAPAGYTKGAFDVSLVRVNAWLDTAKVLRARRATAARASGGERRAR